MKIEISYNRLLTFFGVISFFGCLAVQPSFAQFLEPPKGGEVYKDFVFAPDLGFEFRVTDPNATNPGAAPFLNKPVLTLDIDDLQGATRAEAIFNTWGGHPGTSGKGFSVNGNSTIAMPELASTPDDGRCYMYQANFTVDIPLAQLSEGPNTFEGIADDQICHSFNWGQWGWYEIRVRVYYDARTKVHPTGSITSHTSGSTFVDNPTISVAAQSAVGVQRVEVLAYVDDYDTDGDGRFPAYQGNYHRDQFEHRMPALLGLREHVGTDETAPYDLMWDTTFVPDQGVGAVKFIALIQDNNDVWYTTDEVLGLTLERVGTSVQLYTASRLTQNFIVKNSIPKTLTIHIPTTIDLLEATDAQLLLRTWNGQVQGGTTNTLKVNTFTIPPPYGRDHFYKMDRLTVPTSELLSGDNVISVNSTATSHGIEVLWPGPALVVRSQTSDTLSAPTGLTATAVDDMTVDLDWNNNPETEVTGYDVYRSTSLGFTPTAANRVVQAVTTSAFTDVGLEESQTYYYVITAVGAVNNASPPSSEAMATTPADTSAPTIAHVITPAPDTVTAVFNEPVEMTSATKSGNYSITGDGTITIFAASLLADKRSVTLTTSPLSSGASYTLTAMGVNDLAAGSGPSYDSEPFMLVNLEAHWPFSEGTGTSTADVSGTHPDANLVGGPQWVPDGAPMSSPLSALQFDGVDDSVDLGGDVQVSGQEMTISLWFKADSYGNALGLRNSRLISKTDDLPESNHYWMISTIAQDGRTFLRFSLRTNGIVTTLIGDGPHGDLFTGIWTHVTAVYDGSNMVLYKDGIKVGRTSKSGTIDTGTGIPTAIGAHPPTATGTPQLFHGLIDDVRLYQRVLSAAEIAAINNGNPSQQPVAVPSAITTTIPMTAAATGVTPIAVDDMIYAYHGTTVDIDVLANDDPNGQTIDPTTVMVTSGPASGTIIGVNPTTGAVTYQPSATYTSYDSFTYTVADNEGDTSNDATVDVDVGTTTRVTAGLVALYEFNEGTDPAIVEDTSGVGTPLDLTIDNIGNIAWQSATGSLSVTAETIISSGGPATKVYEAVATGPTPTNALTVEAWIDPANLIQNGPARIVSLSASPSARNLTFAQGVFGSSSDRLNVRLRTTTTNTDGEPSVSTAPGSFADALHHVVYTRDALGNVTIYINNTPVTPPTVVDGDLSTWDATMPLVLANEVGSSLGVREWLGDYHLVAIYETALSAAEVTQNFNAGPSGLGSVNQPPTVTAGPDQPITLPNNATLDGTVADDGLPTPPTLTTLWTVTSGPGGVTFADDTAVDTTATFTLAGVYVLRLTADDTALTAFDELTITVSATNQPPVVDAGPDQMITFPMDTVTLAGAVTADDGFPVPATTLWTQQSGPAGGVTFVNDTDPTTMATFTVDGVYVLELTATDTVLQGMDTMMVTVNPAISRVTAGLVALYEFNEGTDPAIVEDTSGVGTPLDLTIDNIGNIAWQSATGSLSVTAETIISSGGPATKVYEAVATGPTPTNALTVEAWIDPANLIQNGPARIVSLSASPSARNLTFAQGVFGSSSDRLNVRLRTTTTNTDGEPSVSTAPGSFTDALQHVVYTRDALGNVTIYINNTPVTPPTVVGGNLSTWDATMPLVLANEVGSSLGVREWLGDYHLVAIYETALSAAEVTQNFNAGPSGLGSVNQPPTVTAGPDQPITLPNNATLDGTVADDGLPTPPTLTTLWTVTSGPGGVTFADDTAVDTTATFTLAGVYVLRLTADDTALTAFDELTITVSATNQPPVVDAGPDQMITFPMDTVTLAGAVTADDGFPVPATTLWTLQSGPAGGVTFVNDTDPTTMATFTVDGVYVLALTADDTALQGMDTMMVTVNPAISRVTAGLVALYEFNEGTDPAIVEDTSGVGTPLDLTIDNIGNIAWQSATGSLSVTAETIISSGGPATKVYEAVATGPTPTNALTVEAWIDPANLIQNGPARIVSLSASPSARNLTFAQGVFGSSSDRLNVRLRTTTTNTDGEPSVSTAPGSFTDALQHVVYTRDALGNVTIYINNTPVTPPTVVGGNLSTWDPSMPLVLANEVGSSLGVREWLGDYHLVAIYETALSAAEVTQNFNAGP